MKGALSQAQNLPKMLRCWRVANDMTQAQAAHEIGKTQAWLSKIERGENEIKASELIDLIGLYQLERFGEWACGKF